MAEGYKLVNLFRNWPKGVAPRGIVLTNLNEAIPFKGYMLQGEMLLLERTNPDSLGARIILLELSELSAIKLVDPLKTEHFAPLGFEGKLSQ